VKSHADKPHTILLESPTADAYPGLVTSTPLGSRAHAAMTLLEADGPYPPLAEKLMLFGQFVGSWDLENTSHGADGTVSTVQGEWHFAWVLGGRAIQDVIFAVGAPPEERGTSIRAFDERIDAWWVTWMAPAGGEFVQLKASPIDGGIEVIGAGMDTGQLERWSFSEITPDSFVWQGRSSSDGGATWQLDQEMHARRRCV
jgi:hypothetical protein